MLVRVIEKHIPYLGERGTVKEIPDAQAKILLALGKVERVVEAAPEPVHDRGIYSRRDMQAETRAPRKRGRPRKIAVAE